MVEFKKFVIVWLLVVVAGSAFTIVGVSLLKSGNKDLAKDVAETNHFSVQWMGFAPTDYSSQYPEYYVTVNNLKRNNLTMNIALRIKNQEDTGYYFRVEKYEEPPAGWMLLNMSVGLVGVDVTTDFIYPAYRLKPTSITQGRLTETINLAVKAYYDSAYTNLYSQDNFTVKFNLIDRTSSAWTMLYNDNFDDGTTQQWSATGTYGYFGVSNNYYRSFQYSLRLSGASSWASYRKSYDIPTEYQEAYLIFSLYINEIYGTSTFQISLDGVGYFRPDVLPSTSVWYQFTIPLPRDTTTTVDISGFYNFGAYLDDVYVIAK